MISWLDSSNVAYTRMSDREVETTKMNFDNNLSTGLTTPNKDDNRQAYPAPSTDNTVNTRASTLQDLTNPNFYHRDNWFEDMCEILFKLSRRNTTIKAEVYYGFIHYISCLYCLAVVPQQLSGAGYGSRNTVVAVALCSGVGSIFCGLFANLPFVLAPPTVVSIFLSVFLQQTDEGPQEGSIAVVLSGLLLLLIGWKPLGRLAARLIPVAIQVGVAVGIGILTSLAGSTEIDLVEGGEYTIVKMGKITPKICIALSGAILISVATNYHIKGAFCIATIFCSLVWWLYANDWPSSIASVPEVTTINMYEARTDNTALLTVDLIFLYVLYLNGLMTSLSNLAVLTREDDTIPRGRWIFIVCGIFTILSGLVTSAPILVSPESASSIKAGAKTGLSSVVCGILFLLSLFFSPLFEHVPSAGTSPVLIMIGVILYQNVSRIDWRKMSSAAPAFIVLFYVPFTYSIIQGIPA
ncbi:NCS2 family permease [archaeon]|nr:MAG: NCS2 family permease [archaeon]